MTGEIDAHLGSIRRRARRRIDPSSRTAKRRVKSQVLRCPDASAGGALRELLAQLPAAPEPDFALAFLPPGRTLEANLAALAELFLAPGAIMAKSLTDCFRRRVRTMVRARIASRLPLFVALAVAVLIGGERAAAQATWTVDTLADASDGSCADGDCSLRDAIALATAGDAIEFGVAGTITLAESPYTLTLDKDLEMNCGTPAAVTISGAQHRVLEVAVGATVAVCGLTVRDGKASSASPHGGGIRNLGTATLVDVTVTQNRSFSPAELTLTGNAGDGGGIYNAAGATLTLERCTVSANTTGDAGYDSSGMGFRGGNGGGIANAGTLTVSDSTISGNGAGHGSPSQGSGGAGGGIFNSGVLTVTGSTISGNHSGDGADQCPPSCFYYGTDGAGGGIASTGTASIADSTVSGNVVGASTLGVDGYGGGIAVLGGSAWVRSTTIADNTGAHGGGGLYRGGGTLRLGNSIVAGNSGPAATLDCQGNLLSEGYDLLGVSGCSGLVASDQRGSAAAPLDPVVDALADNGGPTATHAVLDGSPAIDAGDPVGCTRRDLDRATDVALATDQRGAGFPRATDGDLDGADRCDVGAFEWPQPPLPSHVVALSVTGTGSGGVVSDPTGIDCTSGCSAEFPHFTDLTLSATATNGSAFVGWGGDCSGSGACQLMVLADVSVSADFELEQTLTVAPTGAGSGTVTSDPAGIDCGTTCAAAFVQNTDVALSATPDSGSLFLGWSGDCGGTGGCTVTLDADRQVGARFEVPLIFADGLETGGLGAWSGHVP